MARVGCKPRVHGPRRCNFQRKRHWPANFSAHRNRRSPVWGSWSVHLISMVIVALRTWWPCPAAGLRRGTFLDTLLGSFGRLLGPPTKAVEEHLQIVRQRHRPV